MTVILTQFTQPDNIIPNPYNPLDWNRYAYVRFNPVNATDPTGNFTCEDSFEGCSRDHTTYTPRITITVSSNFPLTKAEAERYMKLANTAGWWNQYKPGNFSVQDYYQLLLSMEFSPLSGDYNDSLPELVGRDFYARCTGYCNPNSAFDLLRYIAIKGLNTPEAGRNAAPGTIFEDDPHNSTDFVSAITNPKEEWKTGCSDGNTVCNWGNSSMIDYYIQKGQTDQNAWSRYNAMIGSYVPLSTLRTTFYLVYDNWFAFTVNQSSCLYQGKCK